MIYVSFPVGSCATRLWHLLQRSELFNNDLSHWIENFFLKKKEVPARARTSTNIANTQPTCQRPMDGSETGPTSKHVPLVGSF